VGRPTAFSPSAPRFSNLGPDGDFIEQPIQIDATGAIINKFNNLLGIFRGCHGLIPQSY
jgi:hypothetical protein